MRVWTFKTCKVTVAIEVFSVLSGVCTGWVRQLPGLTILPQTINPLYPTGQRQRGSLQERATTSQGPPGDASIAMGMLQR